jgi:predicted nucleic acid-binding protein
MLVVDASCLYAVVADTPDGERVRSRLMLDQDLAAPHVADVEVLGIIRRDRMLGRLDPTAASQAVDDLRDWPGERYGHRAFLARAWELRDRVRLWDAMYVVLAEVLDATLLTLEARLAGVPGWDREIEVLYPLRTMRAQRTA